MKNIIEMLTKKGFVEGFGCFLKEIENNGNIYRCYYCYEENLIAIENINDIWNQDSNEILYQAEVNSILEIENIIKHF